MATNLGRRGSYKYGHNAIRAPKLGGLAAVAAFTMVAISNATAQSNPSRLPAAPVDLPFRGTIQLAAAPPAASRAHYKDLCADQRAKAACAAGGQVTAGLALLDRAPEQAKTLCVAAISTTPDPALIAQAKSCVEKATERETSAQKLTIQPVLNEIAGHLARGEEDKASQLAAELRKKYGDNGNLAPWLSSEVSGRYNAAPNPFLASVLHKLYLAVPRAFWAAIVTFGCLVLLWLIFGLIFLSRRIFRWTYWLRYRKKKVVWKVWSVLDRAGQGAAGAVMDALTPENNPLLRDQFMGPVTPPSLLLAPPPLGGRNDKRVWWNLLGTARKPFSIERLPVDLMRAHVFAFEDAFDEMDLKIGATEVKGVVTAFKNLKRWFYSGFPAALGVVSKITERDNSFWSVRLTCNYGKTWFGPGFRGGREARSAEGTPALLAGREANNISVYATTAVQEFGDPVGLAAHRAGFKLFYRLAEPNEHPDHVTAVAAFHQGLMLLLLLL